MPSLTASHERPRQEWIEIPVPALVSEESFARCPGTSPGKQNTFPPAHHRAERRAGTGQPCQVRLNFLANIDVYDGAQDSLLQMHRFR